MHTIPAQKRSRILTRMKWVPLVACLLLLWHMAIVAATGGILSAPIGDEWELGSNGTALRLLWTHEGHASIAWDDVSSSPRVQIGDMRVYVQIPTWLILVVLAGLALLLFVVDRLKRGDSSSSREHTFAREEWQEARRESREP